MTKNLREQFDQLVAEWKATRPRHSSKLKDSYATIAYQKILNLGPDIVPFILDELQQRPDWWFDALRTLTNCNPVPQEAAGKLYEISSAWIHWGQEQGYINVRP